MPQFSHESVHLAPQWTRTGRLRYGLAMPNSRFIYVTGTDTNVGKTVFTALLCHHLKSQRARVGAMKPFCSGGREDAERLAASLEFDGNLDEINPVYFDLPVAPLVAMREIGEPHCLRDTVERIRSNADGQEIFVVEGAGGLLSPWGEVFDSLDLIQELRAETILVAPNRVGVVNQVLLNLKELERSDSSSITVVLMEQKECDASSGTNAALIGEMAPSARLFEIPFLGENPVANASRTESYKKLKKTLATIMGRP